MSNRAHRRPRMSTRLPKIAPGHADCGCTMRVLEPVESPVCPSCGRVPAMLAGRRLSMPTQAPVGSVKQLGIGCGCGADFEAVFVVVA